MPQQLRNAKAKMAYNKKMHPSREVGRFDNGQSRRDRVTFVVIPTNLHSPFTGYFNAAETDLPRITLVCNISIFVLRG